MLFVVLKFLAMIGLSEFSKSILVAIAKQAFPKGLIEKLADFSYNIASSPASYLENILDLPFDSLAEVTGDLDVLAVLAGTKPLALVSPEAIERHVEAIDLSLMSAATPIGNLIGEAASVITAAHLIPPVADKSLVPEDVKVRLRGLLGYKPHNFEKNI